ncbi:MAG: glucosaminidase domain-containing protein [Paludibacteraceae bacterium]|nr:glucosaminidase domain-containing protein [Paludibacteraceae bacterium]
MKKKYFLIAFVGLLTMGVYGQRPNAAYMSYIEAWKEVAVQQQVDYGIPASITMAQALLESDAGRSELAVEAKNHFGVKCNNDWMGGVYYHDDETQGECFRQYGDAAESFKDHSLFLKRPRYETCFEIAVEDYEGWAYRIRQCGYATDPMYAQKLIRLIETYRLDTLANGNGVKRVSEVKEAAAAQERSQTDGKVAKAAVVHKTDVIAVVTHDPEPPYVAPLTEKEEKENFFLEHPKHRFNGVAFVLAREGDTYSNVAFRLNVRERDLRVNNDALGRDLAVGDRIYLSPKKSTGANEYVWTFPGQTMWALCQEEGVKMEAVQKLNGLDPDIRVFHIRQKIYLKKVKDDALR